MAEEELKTKFLETYAENIENGLYNDEDVQRVKGGDSALLNAYLTHLKGVIADAVPAIDTAFQWRKSFGAKDLTEDSFPQSLINEKVIFFSNTDLAGDTILHIQCVKMRKDLEYTETAKRLVVCRIEKNFQTCLGERIVVLYDMSGTGLNNVDTNFIKFLISCFTNYYPASLSYLVLVDMPWILSAVWTIVKKWLSAEQQKHVKVVKKAELTKMISKDELFTHLGGNCTSIRDPFEAKLLRTNRASPIRNHFDETRTTKALSPQSLTIFPSSQPLTIPPSSKSLTILVTTTEEMTQRQPNQEDNAKKKNAVLDRFNIAFVCVNPLDYMEFYASDTNTLYITNQASSHVAFKIKSTSPNLFKVTPHIGLLKPSNTLRISCTAILGNKVVKQRERMMVSLVLLHDDHPLLDNPHKLNEGWYSLDRSPIYSIDHKIECRLDSALMPERQENQREILVYQTSLKELKRLLMITMFLASFPLIRFIYTSLQELLFMFL